MEFILNRNYVLTSQGHRVEFKKGEPVWVPPMLAKEAAAIGAERLDGDAVDPLPDEKQVPAPLSVQERLDELVAAIEVIVERNDPQDFGGDNRPSLAAINKIVELTDPVLSKRERDDAWKQYKAKKAEE